MALKQRELLDLVIRAVGASGWQSLIVQQRKPFNLRIYRNDEPGAALVIYIWNCTHGGGSARAPDEYRIQFTGAVPIDHPDAITLLLGWHEGYEVFAAWDIRQHAGQDSASPSAQIKEGTLQQAHTHRFAIQTRLNNEIVVAFRPEFFVEYALNSKSLHRVGRAVQDYAVLNRVEDLTDGDVNAIVNAERRQVVATIVKRYRAADFRQRVMGAYNNCCAMCGVQLELIDAAHILPVVDHRSTDETRNGVALCKLHHAAFDRNLVSFDERYTIEVSNTEVARLGLARRDAGLAGFTRALRPALILPSDRRDYPSSDFVRKARDVRKWVP